jgi:hypothetical protein
MKSIFFPVFFFSDVHTYITMESYTTVRDLKSMVMKKLDFNVNKIPYYCLFEVCTKTNSIEERYLGEEDKIVDMLALWDKDKEEYLKKNEVIEFKLYLKIKIFYTYAETDIDTITMLYLQVIIYIYH